MATEQSADTIRVMIAYEERWYPVLQEPDDDCVMTPGSRCHAELERTFVEEYRRVSARFGEVTEQLRLKLQEE